MDSRHPSQHNREMLLFPPTHASENIVDGSLNQVAPVLAAPFITSRHCSWSMGLRLRDIAAEQSML